MTAPLRTILVTVGTHQQPFDRLMRGLESLPPHELVVQHGPARPPAGVRVAKAIMSFPELLENLRRADVVITHAGVGSILCATNEGHVPVVVPRLRRHHEHVDDHQLELVAELERGGHVCVVRDVEQLPAAVDTVGPRHSAAQRPTGRLHDALHAALGARPRAATTAVAS